MTQRCVNSRTFLWWRLTWLSLPCLFSLSLSFFFQLSIFIITGPENVNNNTHTHIHISNLKKNDSIVFDFFWRRFLLVSAFNFNSDWLIRFDWNKGGGKYEAKKSNASRFCGINAGTWLIFFLSLSLFPSFLSYIYIYFAVFTLWLHQFKGPRSIRNQFRLLFLVYSFLFD